MVGGAQAAVGMSAHHGSERAPFAPNARKVPSSRDAQDLRQSRRGQNSCSRKPESPVLSIYLPVAEDHPMSATRRWSMGNTL